MEVLLCCWQLYLHYIKIKAKQWIGCISSQVAISPQSIWFLLFTWFMGWLWVLDRRSTVAVGNFGIISHLNRNPMSVRMALNIPKHFITFLSIFILFPRWAWLSRSLCSAHSVWCCWQLMGPLLTAGLFIRYPESCDQQRRHRSCGGWQWWHLMTKPLSANIHVATIFDPHI